MNALEILICCVAISGTINRLSEGERNLSKFSSSYSIYSFVRHLAHLITADVIGAYLLRILSHVLDCGEGSI